MSLLNVPQIRRLVDAADAVVEQWGDGDHVNADAMDRVIIELRAALDDNRK